MSQKQMDELKDHEYDGIREYDNRLPRWWLGTFILTVVFAFGYWLYYHVYRSGPDLSQEYSMNLQDHQKRFASAQQPAAVLTDASVKDLIKDSAAIGEAKTLFVQNCLACHGAEAQGIIGPNLTDNYWIHGNAPADIYTTIVNGVAEKGMVSWKGILKDDQIKKLVAYIISLEGSNPPNAKPPEANAVKVE